MSKGGGGGSLPANLENAMNTAYQQYNPFVSTFSALEGFNPEAYSGRTMADLSGLQQSAIQSAEGLADRPSYLTTAQQGLENIAQGNTGIGFDQSPLGALQGAQADLSGLQSLIGTTNPALSGLQNLATTTADTSELQNLVGQQNAATSLLSNLASGGTNPFLEQQLANAVQGAVDKTTSQYALGGRLGSDSFAGALGAGITNAALPALTQNLQADQNRQLQAAQALGSVSGQENQQQINLANALLGAQQQDQANQLAATQALGQLSEQGLSQQADIAQNLAALQQSGIGQQADIAQDLAALQLGGSQASTQAQQAALAQLPGLLGADQQIINTLQNVGSLQQAPQQALLDAAQQQQASQNVLDQNRINALLSASGMSSGLYGDALANRPPSALSSGIGGAATGAGLANMLLPTTAGAATMGALAGGGLGLLGLLSDRRLKKNIEAIGKHPNGLTMYTWEWNDTAKEAGFDVYPTSGFIAQEAEKIYPEHVFEHGSGYLMIDYVALEGRRSAA